VLIEAAPSSQSTSPGLRPTHRIVSRAVISARQAIAAVDREATAVPEACTLNGTRCRCSAVPTLCPIGVILPRWSYTLFYPWDE
jgi:hypothetical protein